ncbi:amidohydrolase family protein [Microbulbifer sp. CAU 1566]|uniref:amidohydrolase family protein n=1 Tax=Microbulbifer sp. CAU 1566 TaxID=2933269 RepID=UPI00200576CF|nr:amidohydrolase family protein [Microbulbifer sp. CAU 1566]
MDYLIKNAEAVHAPQSGNVTDLRITNGYIAELGRDLAPAPGETLIDARQCVVLPGLVNTHHHLAQSVLKGVPEGLNQGLGEWLASVPYRFWPHFTPRLMYLAATLGLSELLRSGGTTCADHHYLYHAGVTEELEDAVWQAAEDLGIRLVLCRGGATVSGSHKGMARAGIRPENIDTMLERIDASRSRYHQPHSNAMRKLVVAPTSLIHSSRAEDLRALAAYAREHDLRLHSHLLEVPFDESQAQALHGCSAVEYAARCDWLGPDVWFAHLVQATTADIEQLAATGTGISHCPTSNCRLGSGIAPVTAMDKAGMPVSLGVDGSASSESASMIQEANLSWLLHRAVHGPDATTLERCLDWSSVNGARLLGLDNTGELAIGRAADLVVYDLAHYRYNGVHARTLAPVMAGEPVKVKASFVHGRQVVDNGEVVGLDQAQVASELSREMLQLLKRAS